MSHVIWSTTVVWDSDANSITLITLKCKFLILLIKIFVQIFPMVCTHCTVHVCVYNVCFDSRAIRNFGSLSDFHLSHSVFLVSQWVSPVLFCISMNDIRGTSGKLWIFNYHTSTVCEPFDRVINGKNHSNLPHIKLHILLLFSPVKTNEKKSHN